MPRMEAMTITIDTSELKEDLERIGRGELSLPTVSAFKIVGLKDEIPFYIPEDFGE